MTSAPNETPVAEAGGPHSRYWWNSCRVGKKSWLFTNCTSRFEACRYETKLNRDIGFLKVARSLRNEICMVVDGSSMFRCQPNEG